MIPKESPGQRHFRTGAEAVWVGRNEFLGSTAPVGGIPVWTDQQGNVVMFISLLNSENNLNTREECRGPLAFEILSRLEDETIRSHLQCFFGQM